MAKILDHLPIPTKEEMDFVGPEQVRIKECEIITWVSLSVKGILKLDPTAPRFPAILDTGHTHNFSIQEQHLTRWAGIPPEDLRLLGHIRQAGRRLPLYAVNVWLHPNVPHGRKLLPDGRAQLLELPRGIAVYPRTDEDFPRLPLLGLRALLSNKLHLTVDGANQWVNLRTEDWRTRLLRLLS
jgi:hypothetical protein